MDWIKDLHTYLEFQLVVYLQSSSVVADPLTSRSFIFTNYEELWSAQMNPFIYPKGAITPDPNLYNPAVADVTLEAMTYLRKIDERKQHSNSFTVLLFEINIDRPELHLVFSPAKEPLPDPCRYFNNLSYLPPQGNRSGTVSSPYITKVRVRQYTFGSSAAHSTLSECNLAIVFGEKPSTSVQTVPYRPRPATFFTCNHKQQPQSQLTDIKSRLGEELCEHLEKYVYEFIVQSAKRSRTSIIFTHEPGRWITEFSPTTVMETLEPPIPAHYDHEHFNIEKDALDLVCETARSLTNPVLFVSSIRLGDETNLQMHMLLSDTDELIISYLHNRDMLPLSTANRDYVLTRQVNCEFRQYSGTMSERSFLKKNFSMSRRLEKLRCETSVLGGSWRAAYSRLDNLRTFEWRLGAVLRIHLKDMLTSFRLYSLANSTVTVIFTNDESIWAQERGPSVIKLCELPPIPPDYNHNSFDIVQDVVDYIRIYYMRDREHQKNPLFVSTLTFGEGASSQIHVLMSHWDDRARLLYIKCDKLQNDTVLTPSKPRSSGLSQGASTSTAETGERPVKRQRLSEPGTSRAASLEFTKKSPTPGPSRRK